MIGSPTQAIRSLTSFLKKQGCSEDTIDVSFIHTLLGEKKEEDRYFFKGKRPLKEFLVHGDGKIEEI